LAAAGQVTQGHVMPPVTPQWGGGQTRWVSHGQAESRPTHDRATRPRDFAADWISPSVVQPDPRALSGGGGLPSEPMQDGPRPPPSTRETPPMYGRPVADGRTRAHAGVFLPGKLGETGGPQGMLQYPARVTRAARAPMRQDAPASGGGGRFLQQTASGFGPPVQARPRDASAGGADKAPSPRPGRGRTQLGDGQHAEPQACEARLRSGAPAFVGGTARLMRTAFAWPPAVVAEAKNSRILPRFQDRPTGKVVDPPETASGVFGALLGGSYRSSVPGGTAPSPALFPAGPLDRPAPL